jgi:hypothetical protein
MAKTAKTIYGTFYQKPSTLAELRQVLRTMLGDAIQKYLKNETSYIIKKGYADFDQLVTNAVQATLNLSLEVQRGQKSGGGEIIFALPSLRESPGAFFEIYSNTQILDYGEGGFYIHVQVRDAATYDIGRERRERQQQNWGRTPRRGAMFKRLPYVEVNGPMADQLLVLEDAHVLDRYVRFGAHDHAVEQALRGAGVQSARSIGTLSAGGGAKKRDADSLFDFSTRLSSLINRGVEVPRRGAPTRWAVSKAIIFDATVTHVLDLARHRLSPTRLEINEGARKSTGMSDGAHYVLVEEVSPTAEGYHSWRWQALIVRRVGKGRSAKIVMGLSRGDSRNFSWETLRTAASSRQPTSFVVHPIVVDQLLQLEDSVGVEKTAELLRDAFAGYVPGGPDRAMRARRELSRILKTDESAFQGLAVAGGVLKPLLTGVGLALVAKVAVDHFRKGSST